ncbi:hypothetical protein B9T33_13150 [Acinetobacter sp. ANC 5054]|uniref:hypothetical protein n=1 Tax=Acinetobacter sp. ANC 5054 TaxID=1977877 RepID=UPI000A3433C1|nr:hypothetical protein [Acinetobacter sp. ANC 5054]OTG79137.1 hypothetical protein B9T33_13150 [Acinetobacter sp. ANC 5054]
MRVLHQVAASEIAVIPYYLKRYQQHGLQYRINEYERAEPLGAQCANCHTIVWITGRNDPILNEDHSNIPNSGPIYREYYQNKLKRFLRSLPICPQCLHQAFDLFVNNVTFSRFEDGSPFPKEFYGIDEEMSFQVKDKAVWWYGDEVEVKRLDLHFL